MPPGRRKRGGPPRGGQASSSSSSRRPPPQDEQQTPAEEHEQSDHAEEEEQEDDANNDEEEEEDEEPIDNNANDPDPTPQLFNTTFTTHRLSPLHIGAQQLTASRLEVLARRLRDALVGDVVRGVQIGGAGFEGGGGGDPALGRAGALERVLWRWVPLPRLLGDQTQRQKQKEKDRSRRHHGDRESSVDLGSAGGGARGRAARGRGRGRGGRTRGRAGPAGTGTGSRSQTPESETGGAENNNDNNPNQDALCLLLTYEHATFSALLLPDITTPTTGSRTATSLPWTSSGAMTTRTNGQTDAAFLHLPLLLLKLPAPLKPALLAFLASTFDCRASPLRLGTRSLVRFCEDWLAHSGHRVAAKDISLTLGFHLEPSHTLQQEQGQQQQLGLKTLDVIVPAEEIARFMRAGEKILARGRPPNQNQADGGHDNNGNNKRKPNDAVDGATESHRRLRRRLAGSGGGVDEGWEWWHQRQENPGQQKQEQQQQEEGGENQIQEHPFTEALATYLAAHLGLDLFHPAVRVQRIACAGFVAAESGRVRIARPAPHPDPNPAPDSDEEDEAEAGVGAGARLVRDLVSKAAAAQQDWSLAAVKLAQMAGAGG